MRLEFMLASFMGTRKEMAREYLRKVKISARGFSSCGVASAREEYQVAYKIGETKQNGT